MGDPKVPPIGPRLRAERARRNVSIRALARDIGVSPSLMLIFLPTPGGACMAGLRQPSVSKFPF